MQGENFDVGNCCFGVEVAWVEVDVAREGFGWFGAGGAWFVAVFDDG